MPESNGSSTRFTAAMAACAAAMTASIARADVIYVDDSATAGANTGESWRDAFTDLQSALAIAKEFDEIRVAQGTYKPAPPGGDRAVSFNLVSGTVLRGGYAGFGASDPDANDPVKFETILSGDLNGDDGPSPFTNNDENAYHVVMLDAATARTGIRGITITAGNADDYDPPHRSGGGVRVSGASDLLVVDCMLWRNRARGGSGIANIQSTITIERTRFVGNWCVPMDSTSGGGGLSTSGPTTIDDCWFEDNGGGIGGGGGAISNSFLQEMHVRRTTFYGNHAESTSASKGQAVYVDCLFQSNWTQWVGTTLGGRFINCVFANNGGSEGVGAAHDR